MYSFFGRMRSEIRKMDGLTYEESDTLIADHIP
jgi:hypothetical protein